MKNVRRLLMPAALAVLVFGACETPPEPVDEPPEHVAEVPVTEQVQARDLRNTIMEYELDQYAREEFLEAEAYFEEAERLAQDPDAALDVEVHPATESYIAAIGLYEHVVSVGFAELIQAVKGEIADVRAQAEAIRADVAARSEFEQGVEAYDQGEELELEASWGPAYEAYESSLGYFTDSYDIARAKRTRAEEAMARAQEKEKETERQVREMEDELAEELED